MIRPIVPHFFFSIITFFLLIHLPVKADWSSAKEGNKIIMIRHALAPEEVIQKSLNWMTVKNTKKFKSNRNRSIQKNRKIV